VIKLVLVVSHGNAAVEGGLTSTCWKKQLLPRGLCMIAICNARMDVLKFPVTPKMVSSDRSASAAYKASIAAKQQKKNSRN